MLGSMMVGVDLLGVSPWCLGRQEMLDRCSMGC